MLAEIDCQTTHGKRKYEKNFMPVSLSLCTQASYWAAREGNAHQEIPSIYVEKRQNGGRNAQKALHVPFPLQWGRGMDHLRSSGEQTWKSIWK